MAKTQRKRKIAVPVSITRRLSAAVCLVLISAIMLISSTYAWFTLSTRPEVKGIDTSIAGNGSLEIALMPSNGEFNGITSGRGMSGTYAGGPNNVTAANTSWGNIVNLSDQIYGLEDVWLRPTRLNLETGTVNSDTPVTDTQGNEAFLRADGETVVYFVEDGENSHYIDGSRQTVEIPEAETLTAIMEQIPSQFLADATNAPFQVPTYGFDGRIKELANATLKAHYTNESTDPYTPSQGFNGNTYGVRAIVDANGDTYGYAIDLAFRLNSTKADGTTAGKLLLQTEGVQRISADSTESSTQGGGSHLTFGSKDGVDETTAANAVSNYLSCIRIAFVQNLGNAASGAQASRILAYARADANENGGLYLCDANGNKLNENVILGAMEKNRVYQISVVVWLDGDATTNANMAINNDILDGATLNLQFATDIALVSKDLVDSKDFRQQESNTSDDSGDQETSGQESSNQGTDNP